MKTCLAIVRRGEAKQVEKAEVMGKLNYSIFKLIKLFRVNSFVGMLSKKLTWKCVYVR